MKKFNMSIASFIVGAILLAVGLLVNIQEKVDFAIAFLGVYFILAGVVSNGKLREYLIG